MFINLFQIFGELRSESPFDRLPVVYTRKNEFRYTIKYTKFMMTRQKRQP